MKLVDSLLAKLKKRIGFTLKKTLSACKVTLFFMKFPRFQIKYVWLISAGFRKLKKAPQIKTSLGLGLSYTKVSSKELQMMCAMLHLLPLWNVLKEQ